MRVFDDGEQVLAQDDQSTNDDNIDVLARYPTPINPRLTMSSLQD